MSIFGHFDIEADGPTPSTSNMINIGIVFTNERGKTLQEINVDIKPREGYFGNVDTVKWWSHPDRIHEYERILKDGVSLVIAMDRINTVLLSLNTSKITWVARPAAFDWMFFKCYWDLYKQYNPNAFDIGFSATCLSTIREVWKIFSGRKKEQIDAYFKYWTKDLVMTHNGLDDARYQDCIYHNLVRELQEYSARVI